MIEERTGNQSRGARSKSQEREYWTLDFRSAFGLQKEADEVGLVKAVKCDIQDTAQQKNIRL